MIALRGTANSVTFRDWLNFSPRGAEKLRHALAAVGGKVGLHVLKDGEGAFLLAAVVGSVERYRRLLAARRAVDIAAESQPPAKGQRPGPD